MGREENVTIFKDTEKLCKTIDELKRAIKSSKEKQRLILESHELLSNTKGKETPEKRFDTKAKVIVSGKRSYEAASAYKGQEVCVHNFASATNPGGGVVNGSSAQEECLCRCSTLYFNLNTQEMWDGFYTPHRNTSDPIHNDDCIYTPGVVVMKTDTANPQFMKEKDWYSVNVITCAAPNLRERPSNAMNSGDGVKQAKVTDKELLALHEKRLARILDIALEEKNEVVILGAFGCGAFKNNPRVVARAAKNVIGKYLNSFKTIEFAVYCTPKDKENYMAFKNELKEYLF